MIVFISFGAATSYVVDGHLIASLKETPTFTSLSFI